ncbi:arginine:agmatin antiporter [Salinisphaera sp. T5B8]|uniref:arginine/agmatine antiporter n=1 Tax=Salinisphaera sp. T5B8 TaxID=1304154 RepID=UPI0033422DB0
MSNDITKTETKKMGVVPATLMVAGNMMGSGIFMLPANLSAIGSIALLGWLFTTVGAVALALVFAKLASIDPAAGGPYAYTRKAFGDYMGYQTNMIYWLANVVGNVALAVAGLGYLSHFFPVLQEPIVLAFACIAVIWFFTYANILGPHVVGRMQSFTTIFALVPIFGMAIFGWFWFNPETFSSAWNVSGQSSISAVMATFTFTLWAFIGVESASVSAGVLENPSRNVPIATVGGVVLASIAYILSSSVIMGMIPNRELISSAAPFADAARVALGDFAGSAVALAAAVGCLGSLAGWTLLTGQSAKAAADDGLFPAIFARVNKRDVPSLGLVIVAVIMSVQVLATMSPTASQQFGKIASIAVIMTLLPYIYSMVSVKVLGYRKMPHGQYTFFVSAGLLGAIYCLIALVGSDGEQTRWSLIFVIATIVFYSAAVTRKRDIEEKHLHVGGISPVWVRYLALAVTITALVVTFYLSVGRQAQLDLHSRSVAPSDAPAPVQKIVPKEQ